MYLEVPKPFLLIKAPGSSNKLRSRVDGPSSFELNCRIIANHGKEGRSLDLLDPVECVKLNNWVCLQSAVRNLNFTALYKWPLKKIHRHSVVLLLNCNCYLLFTTPRTMNQASNIVAL